MRSKAMLAAGSCLAAASLLVLLRHVPVASAASEQAPAYAPNGDMLPPANYREWIYLSSGIDMSYSPNPAGMTMFDNVFVNPEAYRSFVATGAWPDKTVMVLEVRGAESKGSINQSGHYQSTDVMGVEVHVKDKARFPGNWAFFAFDSPGKNGTLIPQGAPCYSCHVAHGAVDTTFVQFYPTLLPIARDKKTLSDAFLKEEAAQAAGK
ncbi:MAG: cytochrome P460 family protein [Terracidiphilus sp.]|jgi:hypothetical protein